ncbi:MAG: hypothetical protein ACHQM6_08845, partial [Candidatus Kapaibacterium sp.]
MKTEHVSLNGLRIGLLMFLFICTISDAVHSQSKYPAITPTAYKTAIEAEFTTYGASRYLYDNADAYQRLIQIHALTRLGYDFATAETGSQNAPEGILQDTSLDVSSKGTSDQEETTIAVSRVNSLNIVAGSNDYPAMVSSGMPAYYTLDGGKTWSVARMPKLASSSEILGDPAIVASDSGYFYYAYLAAGSNSNEDNVMVASSKDGRVWKNGAYVIPQGQVGGFEDKENI